MRFRPIRILLIALLLLGGLSNVSPADEPFDQADSFAPLQPQIDDPAQVFDPDVMAAEIVDASRDFVLDNDISESSGNILLTQATSGAADGSEHAAGDLASKSQNPISDLVSLPLQNNWSFGSDPGNRTSYVGNLQPVIPVKLNEDWNLINRFIVPFENYPIGPDERTHGIGDTTGQFFFSPRDSGRLIWGVGPSVLFPTASDPVLGGQEWGVGVNAVGLISEGHIVAGVLVNQMWGTRGTTKPFLLQPFFNYNLPKGWYLNVSGEASADWERPEESRWVFPLGGGFGRVFPLFGQPINLTLRFAPYLEKPPGGPDWQFRFQVNLLFPK